MNGHQVALWAAVSAFFASLIAVGLIDLFSLEKWVEFVSTIFIAAITGAATYSKLRLDEAQKAADKKEKAAAT